MYQNSKNTDDQKRLKETKYLLDWELIPSRNEEHESVIEVDPGA